MAAAAACTGLTLRRPGLQRERMQLAAHLGLERLVNQLVLLDPGFAAEAFRDHRRRIMIAIACEVADRDLGVRQMRPDQAFYIACNHGHDSSPEARSRGPSRCRRSVTL